MASKSKFDRRSRPLPDYSTKVRRWAALADANEIKELRAHAKRYALVLPAHLDAESILLELCVTTLQRMFRLRLTLYKTFGNLLFARSVQPDEKAADYGQPRAADFGTVAWSAETEDSPYLVCSDATSPRLLANFLRYGPWKIPRPDLLITVVGGARNFELQPPQLARLFSKGFGEAAIAANAVVTAAGTDAGVAKLVAHALAETGGNLPMIGVAPFSKMLGAKELLEGKSGEEVSYTNLPAPITDEAPLNPDHTHFIFVDSGKKTTWGTELRLRAEFEAEYAKMLHIPVAQLCVQGGPGTVQGLYESALKGTPIVIVAESGGCATDMYNFVMKDIELPKKYGDLATKGSLAAMIAEVKVLHEVKHNGRLLSFFSLERGDVDLAAVLLRAVVNLQTVESLDPALTDQIGESAAASALRSRLQRSLARALKLAVVWGRVDVAKDILDLLGGMRKAYPAGAGSTPAAQEALQAAIQLGRFELCKALMDQPGADVGAIDVVQLYLNPGRFFFLSHNKILTEGLTAMFNEQKRRACLPETLADTKTSSVATLRHASIESDTRGIGVGRASLTMAANTSPPGNRSSPEAQEGDASIRVPSLPGAKRKRGARDGARRMSLAPGLNMSFVDRVSKDPAAAAAANKQNPREMPLEEAYYMAVGPLFRAISPRIESLVLDYSRFDYTDLFLWSTMSGEFRLAELFWPLTGRPLATAMIGSYVCKYMLNEVFIGHAEIEKQAATMQGWAVGTLESIPSEERAHQILLRVLTTEKDERRFNLVDLALFLNMKQVLSQRYVQTLIDRIWRGDVGSAMYPLPLRYSWGYYLKVPIYFLSLGLLSPPVRGYLMGRRRQRQVAPVFIFDAFTKAKKLLEFQMDEAVKREEETNKQVADGEQAPSPTRQSSTTVPRISDTTRARYRSKVSEAFDHAHMEGSVDDGFTSDDVVSSWVLSQLSGWELLGNFIAYWHIPAIKFMLRVYIDLILCFLYLLTIMSNPTIEQLDELRDSCEGKGPGCFSRPFSHTKEPVLSASPQTTGNIPVVELTLYIVGFSIMFDSMYINVRRTNGLDFEAGADAGVRFFTYMKLWRRIMLVTSLVLRLLAVNADWDYTLRRQLYTANGYIMAFATFFAFFHLLEAFSQSEDVSVLVIMIARMMDDLIVFLKLAIIIILSFTASFVGLEWVGSMDLSDEEPNLQEEMAVDFEQSQQTPVHLGDGNIEEHFGYGTSFSSRLFRFGYGLSEDQSGNAFSRGDEAKPGFPIGVPMWGFIGEVGPLDSFDTVADIWMWIFVFVSTVILVNLLVAMFADTYSHTKENSKTEALAARYRRIFEHKRLMTVLPPPLNLPYVLFFLSCHYLKAAVNGCSAVCGLCFRGTAKYRVGVMPTAALNAFVSGASGKNLVQDKARRKEALIERSVKQYVERFLEYKEQEQAESVESVVRNTSEHVGAMQESFASKLNLLTDKVDKLVAAMEASQPSQGSGGGVSYSIG